MIESSAFVDLVAFQRRLLKGFFSRYPDIANKKWLLGARFEAELSIESEVWDVTKHGVGLRFTRRKPTPNVVVDVHVALDNPNRLDAWRLQQYLESIGGLLEFDDAEEVLQGGVKAGTLARCDDGGYELRS